MYPVSSWINGIEMTLTKGRTHLEVFLIGKVEFEKLITYTFLGFQKLL